MIDLDGLEMCVSSTATNGVVGSDTRLRFTQRGRRASHAIPAAVLSEDGSLADCRTQSSSVGMRSERVGARFIEAARSARLSA
jgi:hypothetical protein